MQFDTEVKVQASSINQINSDVRVDISKAWEKISPAWPLKNLIAVNPLRGFEDLLFEHALMEGAAYFQCSQLPVNIQAINRETIKWCQAFFDEGQATINMPLRQLGLYQSWRQLIPFDERLHQKCIQNRTWLRNLPNSAEQTVTECLVKLNIPLENRSLFLTLLLTTLPGWAGYVKYRTEWRQEIIPDTNRVSQSDYLAMRLVITCLLWPSARDLLSWYQQANISHISYHMMKINDAEKNYHASLLKLLSKQTKINKSSGEVTRLAQLVFCIDVRSEPLRRVLEAQGNYETFGFAGFFGIPARIKNQLTEESYSSCPVLITPKHIVQETPHCSDKILQKTVYKKKQIIVMKRLYQALKYTFTIPFALVEALGPWCGLWMSLKTVMPRFSVRLKKKLGEQFQSELAIRPSLTKNDNGYGIDIEDQCVYAESMLRMIGLTDNFSQLIVLCGHGSVTQNNAYASALDCGACGGNQGAGNARILADILNNANVRKTLVKQGIKIPAETLFIAALHDTTTDEVTFFEYENNISTQNLKKLKQDLEFVQQINNRWRCQQMGYAKQSEVHKNYTRHVKKRSADWAQTRPEWGLARNASFIIGPRNLTNKINLDGRAFLHSYEWKQDKDGAILSAILTAPMVVAQWINNQYLFSSLDNVAYGSGSKITHNITGKIGVMQGNGSDLMHGLPLQSIYSSDIKAYHEPLRLMTIVYAPCILISKVIDNHEVLQKLFSNGWVLLACIEPDSEEVYLLQRDLTWQKKWTNICIKK